MSPQVNVSMNAHVRSSKQILDPLNVSQLPSASITTADRETGLDGVSCWRCHRLFKCFYRERIEKDCRNTNTVIENTLFREISVILAGDEHLFSVFVFDMLILSCVPHIPLSLVSLYFDRISAYTTLHYEYENQFVISMIKQDGCLFPLSTVL